MMEGEYVEVTRIFEFDAAHWLAGHKGKCSRLHGHTYKLEVTVGGEVSSYLNTDSQYADIESERDVQIFIFEKGKMSAVEAKPPFFTKQEKPHPKPLEDCMVADFGDIKKWVQEEVLDALDHSLLNEVWVYPTAEAMVVTIAARLAQSIRDGALREEVQLARVRLWETSNSYAEARLAPAEDYL